MRFVIVGQKWFAGAVLDLAASHGEVVAVLGTAGACRFTEKAAERGIPIATDMVDLERMMRGRMVDLLITAHATKFVPATVRALAAAAIGYHPYLDLALARPAERDRPGDDRGRRRHCRRHGVPSRRWLGRGADRVSGLVLRAAGLDSRRSVA